MMAAEHAVSGAVVDVRWEGRAGAPPATGVEGGLAERLERFGRRALHHLNLRVEVSVLLCGSDAMQSLNARYRGIAAPTDVLSFAQMDASRLPAYPQPYAGHCLAAGGPGHRHRSATPESHSEAAPPPSAGDVVIATDVAARQAAARGEPAERELCRLLLHGMLHLAGMDHADPPREHEPMLSLQERTLQTLWGDAASTTP